MTLIISTLLVAVISAICPLVNLEVFIAGVGALGANVNVWWVASAAALGQSIGKLFWYEIGASAMRWSYIENKMQSPRWKACYATMRNRVEQRVWMATLFVLLSAVFGLPPLAIMAVLCGQLHFNRALFFATTFIGRTLRFASVLGGMAWIAAR